MGKKLNAAYYLRQLKLIERNNEWLRAGGVSVNEKIGYYGQIVKPYVMRQKHVKYLGKEFYYDNIATPLNLQNYPYEISNKILANMTIRPKTILDIGGNIGQFSITINHVLNSSAKVHVFEPNSYVFEMLQKNISHYHNITAYNYGVGDTTKKQTLYYDKNRTGIGSIIAENAGDGVDSSQEIAIVNDPSKLTHRKSYDLIKIDVEGYELHVVKALKNTSFKYLYLEVSAGRTKDYIHSVLFGELQKVCKAYDIVFCNGFQSGDNTFELLIKVQV